MNYNLEARRDEPGGSLSSLVTHHSSLSVGDVLALIFAMTFPTLGASLYFILLAGSAAMRPTYAVCKLVQFALPLFWVCIVQRQRIRLAWPQKKGIKEGLVFGLVVVAAMVAAYLGYLRDSKYLSGAHEPIWAKLQEIGADTPLTFLMMALLTSVVHSFFEEYYWRWFVFAQLRRRLPLFGAAVLSGLAFMGHHVIVVGTYLKPEHFWTAALFFSLCVAVGGAVWAWIYHRAGSLYGPWLSHFLVDAALMWIGFDLCRRYWA